MTHVFKCGVPVLDFLGTLRLRRNAAPIEVLTAPETLDAWFRESGIVDGDTHCEPSDLEDAVALREAIYLLVAARLAGDGYDAEVLELVNGRARTPSAVPQLTQAGRRIEATAQQALSSVARQAVQLLGGPEGALLKECSRPECTQIFVDRSRGGGREWCAMDPCGNRVKAAAYRARKRTSKPRRSASTAPAGR
ncbi:CGNR zinc finger domain-containing protein [Streptomyces chiangmaiensis]|uniref:ABATE domain-containing protein n=1 Tax=Streptomyces chiangmaiensis TaxID=766497 RepID=A0ABU7FQV4_9ACTN|nr:ABATE domain-containing protein [Streptomyces chiangmaiensis]MED7826496.1 ABATE domain-containing protein [Streptomyces chiangmaiensis]